MICKKCKTKFKGSVCPSCAYQVAHQKVSVILGVIQSFLFLFYGQYCFFNYISSEAGNTFKSLFVAIFLLVFLLIMVFSLLSGKRKWANIVLIILGVMMSMTGILAIIGGIMGYMKLSTLEKEQANFQKKQNTFLQDESKEKQKREIFSENEDQLIYTYSSPLLRQLKDPKNHEMISLENEGKEVLFKKVFTVELNGKLCCLLHPVSEEYKEDLLVPFVLEEADNDSDHQLRVAEEEEANEIFGEYGKIHVQTSEKAKRIEVSDIDVTKEKKSYRTATIVMSIMYVLILVIAILGIIKVFGGILASLYDGNKEAGEALSCSIGFIFLSFLPTIGYFLAFNRWYEINKKSRITVFLVCLILSVILIVLFFILYSSSGYKETIDKADGTSYEQYLTIVVSHVGLLLTYLLTFLNIDYEKLNHAMHKFRKKDEDDPKSDQFLNVILAYILQLLKFIARFFIGLLKIILKLRDKSKAIYFVLFTLIFTILCYFSAFIALVVCIGIVIALISLYFFGVMKILYIPTTHNVYEVNDGGYTRVLQYYDCYNGHDRYKDDVGAYWYTDDQGTTFYKE